MEQSCVDKLVMLKSLALSLSHISTDFVLTKIDSYRIFHIFFSNHMYFVIGKKKTLIV